MPHIHTEPGQYDQTASAYIFRHDGNEPKLLLHMHKKILKLMQPGGHIELNETPWQAMLHEITEETGYELSQLQVLQPAWALKSLDGSIVHPVAFCINSHDFMNLDHKHTDLSFAFVASGLPEGKPELDNGESADLRWVTRSELEKLTDEEVNANVRQVAILAFDECLKNWQPTPLSDYKS